MTKLIACLCAPVQTWPEMLKLVKSADFDRVIIFVDDTAKKAFKPPAHVRVVPMDGSLSHTALRDYMVSALKDEEFGMDVAVNFSSGSGKEHAALLSAVLRVGLGVRLVFWQDSVAEL